MNRLNRTGRRTKFLAGTLSLFMCALRLSAASAQNAIDQASRYELDGKFREAQALLRDAKSSASEQDRGAIGFEIERLDRVRKDFRLSREALFLELKESVSGLSEAEFDRWVSEGRFDSRMIDGTRWFMGSSVSNLFFRYPELDPRRTPPKPTSELSMAKWQRASEIKAAARQSGTPYVLPKTLEATMTVSIKPGAVQPGDKLQAWLPVPRAYPFQKGFEILSTTPRLVSLAPEDSPIRSAYFETTAKGGAANDFKITYRFTTYGVSFDLDPAKAVRSKLMPDLVAFTNEAPHVVFTPEMRKLAAQIAGSETNVLLRAKRYYDWIGENIKYSYAIEYSTIRNISDYCRTKCYGDCGQEALLFITLCRMDGIPARWQSGWNLFPKSKTIHDWSEIYIEPWGWVPVDPYMSIFATRYASGLTAQQKRELRDFYFGGLDQYRMAANCDHTQQLSPAKTGYRSDTVDFQRGEIDSNGKNLYFDKFSYSLDYKEIVP